MAKSSTDLNWEWILFTEDTTECKNMRTQAVAEGKSQTEHLKGGNAGFCDAHGWLQAVTDCKGFSFKYCG